jgi:hypothetical protein
VIGEVSRVVAFQSEGRKLIRALGRFRWRLQHGTISFNLLCRVRSIYSPAAIVLSVGVLHGSIPAESELAVIEREEPALTLRPAGCIVNETTLAEGAWKMTSTFSPRPGEDPLGDLVGLAALAGVVKERLSPCSGPGGFLSGVDGDDMETSEVKAPGP